MIYDDVPSAGEDAAGASRRRCLTAGGDDDELPGDQAGRADVVGVLQPLDAGAVAAGDGPQRVAAAHAVGGAGAAAGGAPLRASAARPLAADVRQVLPRV